MEVISSYPPNIELINLSDLKPNKDTIFCYGNKIYNPHKVNILPDVEYHESIHAKQQGDNPDLWWSKYIICKQFRLEQETIAYGEQHKFSKENVKNNKLVKWRLEQMATSLSGEVYGNLINYHQAESVIRNYSKYLE